MGSSRFDANEWDRFASTSLNGKTKDQVLNTRGIVAANDPAKFKNGVRESRDSAANPRSTPLILAGDVTGSMDELAFRLLRETLPAIATEIYQRKPVTDPHILVAAVGDVAMGDRAPFQATQFEAGATELGTQTQALFVEKGGGGNQSESYHLPWYFAAMHTSHDAFEKRGEKGILFTYGDEGVPPALTRDQIERVFGTSPERDYTTEQLLAMARRTYDVYHLVIMEGSHARQHPQVLDEWRNLLGEHAIRVDDHTRIGEIIVSILQIRQGHDHDSVAASWSGDTALVVRSALQGLTVGARDSGTGLVAL
jgi:cell division protein FtsL